MTEMLRDLSEDLVIETMVADNIGFISMFKNAPSMANDLDANSEDIVQADALSTRLVQYNDELIS